MKDVWFTMVGKVTVALVCFYALLWLYMAVISALSTGYREDKPLNEYDESFVTCRVVDRLTLIWPSIVTVYDKPVEFCENE